VAVSTLDEAREHAATFAVLWAKERNCLTPAPILPGDVTPDVDDNALWERVHEMGAALNLLATLHKAYLSLVDEITSAKSEARKHAATGAPGD